jgi:hypothetical protein
MAACGKCIWQYIDQVWARTSECTGTCRCPDTIDEDIDTNVIPNKVRTFANQSKRVTLASGAEVEGIENATFKDVLRKLAKKGVVVEHRKFGKASDRSDRSKGVLKKLTKEADVLAAFAASDTTATFEVDCVQKRVKPGDPQDGMFVIGG